MSKDTAIGFLVINQNSDLPRLSIQSALNKTQSDIYVGFIDEMDLTDLPINQRISFIKLNSMIVEIDRSSQAYKDFSNIEFYKIVQLKWQLFEKLMPLNYNYIVYSDFDITWINDPIPDIEKTFMKNGEVHVLSQSFTSNPSDTRLCMGFAAFRISPTTQNFIMAARRLHADLIKLNPLIGDDDIITKLYSDLGQPTWLRELPQSTFPVGSMLNLFSKKNSFPGLSAPVPYIFHANYVVGLKNKRILTSIISRRFHVVNNSAWHLFFDCLILLKRSKYFVVGKKRKLFNL